MSEPMADFPEMPDAVLNCLEYRDSLLERAVDRFDLPVEEGPDGELTVWGLIYGETDADELTDEQQAACREIISLTLKVEYWRLTANRQNFTEVKAVEHWAETVEAEPVVPFEAADE